MYKDTIMFFVHRSHAHRRVQMHLHTTTYSCVSACTGSDVVEPKRTSWFCARNSPLCLCFLHVWLACSWKGCAASHPAYDVSCLFVTGLRTLAYFLVLCACREPVSTLCVGNCDRLDFLDKRYSCWWKWFALLIIITGLCVCVCVCVCANAVVFACYSYSCT